MKRKDADRRALLAGLGGAVAGSLLIVGKAKAGNLEPPGAPAPTGRSLKEIEPRTPVETLSAGPGSLHDVTLGGSYKLTGNLTVAAGQVAIRVLTADPVSIDLGGFTIDGGGGGGGGIRVQAPAPGCTYVEVFDGYIQDMDGDGIDGGSARVLECNDIHIAHVTRGIVSSGSMIVEGCHIEHCTSDGIQWNKASSPEPAVFIVDDCEVRASGGKGLSVQGNWTVGSATASITETDLLQNGQDGLSLDLSTQPGSPASGQLSVGICLVRASSNGARGMTVTARSTSGLPGPRLVVQCEDVVCTDNAAGGIHMADVTGDLIDCVCSQNVGDGCELDGVAGSIDNCLATGNTGDGVHLLGACHMSVTEVSAHSNSGAGLHLDLGVTGIAVQDSDAMGGSVGIRVQSPGNLLLRNTATGNGADYQLDGVTPVVIVTPSDLTTNCNPHANYASQAPPIPNQG